MDNSKLIEELDSLIKEGIALKNNLLEDSMSSYGSFKVISWNRQYYQDAERWKMRTMNILNLRFGNNHPYLKEFESAICTHYQYGGKYCKENVGNALGILEATKDALEKGFTEDLFYQREVVLLADLLDQAYEFLEKGFDLAATIYGRVVLEMVIKEFASKNGIKEKDFEQTIISLRKSGLIIQPLEQSLRANYAIGSAGTHNKEEFTKITKQDIKSFLDFIRDKVLTL